MANIPRLPSGADLILAEPSGVTRQAYGPYLVVAESPNGEVHLFAEQTGSVYATLVKSGGGAHVDLAALDRNISAGVLVPYINRFIDGSGQHVERYWRTKTYRIVSSSPAAKLVGPAPAKIVGSKPRTIRQRVGATKPALSPFVPAAEPKLTPFAAVEPEVEHPEDEPALVGTTDPEPEPEPVVVATDDDTDIPGVEVPAKVSVKSAGRGFVKVGTIVTAEEDYQTLLDAWALRQTGVPSAVLITGPSGTAKTALVRAFAAAQGVRFLKVDGGAIRTADDWAGAFRQDPNTKVWAHRWSPFARVLQSGRPTVVLIDELNRTESPQALNALTGLLDWTGQLLVPDANTTLRMPPGVLVVATANIGPEFVGTLPLDGAVRQRFPYGIRMGYPPEKIETALIADLSGIDTDLAARLVRLADSQRVNREDPQLYPSGMIISTRVILDIARRIATCNTDPSHAVWATLRGQFDAGDEPALRVVIEAQFPPKVEEAEDALTEVADLPAEDWRCPSCYSFNPSTSTHTCNVCGYARPVGSHTIQLQPKAYNP